MKAHNPYVGPRAFQDGEMLYGRDREVRKLLNLLIAERIVLLYSPSGAGKTSLIQAALMPALREEGFRVFPIIRVGMEPPPDLGLPTTTDRYILSTLLSLEERLPPEQQMSLEELAGIDLSTYLDRRLADDEVDGDVLIFDQFEEILTVDPTDQETKTTFFAQLGKALRPRDRWALFAMREEYPAGLDPYLRPVPTRLSTTFRLELLGAKAARQAMQEPARQAGVPFTDIAAEKLIDDLRRVQVQQPDGSTAERPGLYIEPVQLQVVCYRLWENLPNDATEIRETDLREAGDVDSALAGYYADRVKATAENTGVRERVIREWIDKQLITEQGIRGQVLRGPEQSQGLENQAIEPLVDAHLVRAENRRGATWYELAHDRLVEPVRKDNAAWFEANLSPLQRQADLWQSQGRSGNLLLRDEALEEADHWAAEHENELTPVERDFLEACREARAVADARQAIAQAERERRKNRFIQVLAVVAVIFSIVAGYFYFQARQSEKAAIQSEKAAIQSEKEAIQAKNESLTQSVAFQSLFQHESGRDERAALLARQAYLFNQEYQISVLHQVDNTLRTALPQHFSYILPEEHKNAVNAVAISRDGNRLVSGSDDETVRLWDLTDFDAEPEELPEGHTGRVWTVAVSPDGKIVASGSEDETVRWWVLTANGAMPQEPLKGHEGAVYSVAFSPDGKILASGSSDETVRLWNLEDPSAGPIVLRGHEQGVNSVAFSPDGKTLASGSDDMTVRLWNPEDPSASAVTLQGHEAKVYSVAFSRDGKTLASGSADNTIRLWKPQRPNAVPALLRGHEAPVRSVAFSSDGKTLASGSDDKTVRLWNPAYPSTSAAILRGHEKSVTSVVFSPDGDTLTSASKDNTIRQWNRQPSGSAPIVLRGHTSTIWSLAFAPAGQFFSSISKDQTLLWDLQNPDTDPIEQREYEEAGYLVAFSPDGKMLASGGDNIQLRDLADPDEAPETLEDHEKGHKDMVWSVAFSPDGKTLASGGDDVRLWDLTARDAKHKQTLKGHEGIVYAVAFSPDGRFLASGGRDKTVRLWDLTARNGKLTKSLQGHEGTVYALAFSPDSRLLASGSNDKTIQLWNLGNPSAAPIILRGHEQDVTSLAFSPDGEFLVSGSKDQTVRIWTWRTEILAEMVCKNVRHNLRLDEWCQFVSADLPYECTCSNWPPGEGATQGVRCE